MRMRYRPNGLTSEGRITAQGVLTRPTFANSRYVGIARAVVGTMMAPSTRLNPARSPRNRNLANPYPAAAAGYGFAKFRFRGDRAGFNLVLGAIMVPTTALAIPTYLLFAKVGLVNTPWAVILPSLVSPFGLYLMRIYAEDAVPD